MSRTALFEWEGREYDYNPKTADWYWALGIIAMATIIALILFGSYLLALLVLVATSAIALHAAKRPPIHHFCIVDQGLLIGDDLHLFERMESFSVLEDIDGEFPPILSIKTHNWLSPHLIIPLEGVDVDSVYECFLINVDEGDHKHSITDIVATLLGF